MDILGTEIDPSFVYKVSPIRSCDEIDIKRKEAKFRHGFTLSFKDGKTQDFFYFFDFYLHGERNYGNSCKDITIRMVPKMSHLALTEIKNLRQAIVDAINNPVK